MAKIRYRITLSLEKKTAVKMCKHRARVLALLGLLPSFATNFDFLSTPRKMGGLKPHSLQRKNSNEKVDTTEAEANQTTSKNLPQKHSKIKFNRWAWHALKLYYV